MQPVRVHRPAGADVGPVNHVRYDDIFYPAVSHAPGVFHRGAAARHH